MCYSVIDRSWPYHGQEATHSTAYLATDILRWVAQHWRGWEGICGKWAIYMYHFWGGDVLTTLLNRPQMQKKKQIESVQDAVHYYLQDGHLLFIKEWNHQRTSV